MPGMSGRRSSTFQGYTMPGAKKKASASLPAPVVAGAHVAAGLNGCRWAAAAAGSAPNTASATAKATLFVSLPPSPPNRSSWVSPRYSDSRSGVKTSVTRTARRFAGWEGEPQTKGVVRVVEASA
jgi:hypothetical protein